ncbi:uncharacterized protein LOC131883069 [Tigriopus californicus]|uniref:uncharacterized protein LOC131883069 n=1 Tax=Tigriopus californicus TaxID=6832 RepID=UPI0027DA4F49|nr:uncharacterized protein LOC131883069 [Tigriopus californicus]
MNIEQLSLSQTSDRARIRPETERNRAVSRSRHDMLSVIQPTPAMGGPFQRPMMGPMNPPGVSSSAQAPFSNYGTGFYFDPSRSARSGTCDDLRVGSFSSSAEQPSGCSVPLPGSGKPSHRCNSSNNVSSVDGGVMFNPAMASGSMFMGPVPQAVREGRQWPSAIMGLNRDLRGNNWLASFAPGPQVSHHDAFVMKQYHMHQQLQHQRQQQHLQQQQQQHRQQQHRHLQQQQHQQQQQQQQQQERQRQQQQQQLRRCTVSGVPKSVPAGKDYSKPLFVDCSIEYDLPNAPKIPKNSDPILMIHPAYSQKLVSSMKSVVPSRAPQSSQSRHQLLPPPPPPSASSSSRPHQQNPRLLGGVSISRQLKSNVILPPVQIPTSRSHGAGGVGGVPMRPGDSSRVCSLKNCQCNMALPSNASQQQSQINSMLKHQQQERMSSKMLLQHQAVKRSYASMQHPYLKPRQGVFFSSSTGMMDKRSTNNESSSSCSASSSKASLLSSSSDSCSSSSSSGSSASRSDVVQPPPSKRTRVLNIPETPLTHTANHQIPTFWHPPTPHPIPCYGNSSNISTSTASTATNPSFWHGLPRNGVPHVVHVPVTHITHITPPQSTCDLYHQKQWEQHSRYLAAVALAKQQQLEQQKQQLELSRQQRSVVPKTANHGPTPTPSSSGDSGIGGTCSNHGQSCCADGKCQEAWNKENLGIMRSL